MDNVSNNDASAKSKRSIKNFNVKKPSKKILTIGLLILSVLAIGSAVYFYKQYQDVKNNPKDAIAAKNSQETQDVIGALKKIILIDTNEAPTVARVENPDTLKQNNATFYKNVAKGDYLVIFKDRAIIFRASENQIINIAPIVNTGELEAKKAEQEKQAQQNKKNNSTTTNNQNR